MTDFCGRQTNRKLFAVVILFVLFQSYSRLGYFYEKYILNEFLIQKPMRILIGAVELGTLCPRVFYFWQLFLNLEIVWRGFGCSFLILFVNSFIFSAWILSVNVEMKFWWVKYSGFAHQIIWKSIRWVVPMFQCIILYKEIGWFELRNQWN